MGGLRNLGVRVLRRLASATGGVLLSRTMYDQMLVQRSATLRELVTREAVGLEPGLTCIIFSKDRALQLYTLLHTYFEKVTRPVLVHVVYGARDEAHRRAYGEVAAAFAGRSVPVEFHFEEEKGFQETLLSVLGKLRCRSVMFLVDDIVFIRSVDLAAATTLDPAVTVLSLRHSPHLRRSYTADVSQRPPSFRPSALGPDMVEFNWFEEGNEWSDPWSVDGQVLSTAEVKVITRISRFKAPNSYENCLKSFNDIAASRKGLCFRESVILNLPINRVQTEIANISGDVSADFLLEQWQRGLMLDTSMFDTHIPVSPHEEHVVRFRSRA